MVNTWRVSVWRLRQTRSRASEYSMHAVERDLGNPSASPGPSLGHSWSAIHLSGIPRSRRPHRCAFVSSTNWFNFQLIGYPKYDVAHLCRFAVRAGTSSHRLASSRSEGLVSADTRGLYLFSTCKTIADRQFAVFIDTVGLCLKAARPLRHASENRGCGEVATDRKSRTGKPGCLRWEHSAPHRPRNCGGPFFGGPVCRLPVK